MERGFTRFCPIASNKRDLASISDLKPRCLVIHEPFVRAFRYVILLTDAPSTLARLHLSLQNESQTSANCDLLEGLQPGLRALKLEFSMTVLYSVILG